MKGFFYGGVIEGVAFGVMGLSVCSYKISICEFLFATLCGICLIYNRQYETK